MRRVRPSSRGPGLRKAHRLMHEAEPSVTQVQILPGLSRTKAGLPLLAGASPLLLVREASLTDG
jgi:hypothetical protein